VGVAVGVAVWSGGATAGAQSGPDGTTTTTEAEQEAEQRVFGFVRNTADDNAPVEGVTIVVTTSDGDEVGESTTDADGAWEVPLDEPGQYVATLDQDTLPDGVDLRDEDKDALPFAVERLGSQPLTFPLGPDNRQVSSEWDRFLQLFVEGLKFGLVIAMGAIGLSLIFGTTGLTNFSHGEMVTFGALVTFYINIHMGLNLILATLVAIIVCAAAAALYDFAFWRPLRRRGTGLIAMLVISIGMAMVLRYFFQYIFDSRRRPFGDYAVQRAVEIGPVEIAPKDIYSMIIAVAVLIGVGLVLQKTKIGKAMRAVADNRDLAESSGIDVDRVILVVWAVGGGLACLGGVMFGITEQVRFDMGFRLLLLMFAGVTLGGLGTAYGALVGSLIVGIFIQVSTLWIPPELKNVGALALLILILLVRPQGILGQAERVG
jgi:branched-chain amino acid transport system permease protein